MRYEDYKVEVTLLERVPGYGNSVDLCVTAANETAAGETARHDFAVFTGLPSYIIESVEVAPVPVGQAAG